MLHRNDTATRRRAFPARKLVYTALMTALVTLATAVLGFRTGDFFFNCGDAVIFVTATLLGPLPAMIAGGLGSFFADLAVYPATMFFTLVIKGLEGLLCGALLRLARPFEGHRVLMPLLGTAATAVAGAFMMTGYYVSNTFFYGTPASALAALPADAVQAAISVALASVILYAFRLAALKPRLFPESSHFPAAAPYLREDKTPKTD